MFSKATCSLSCHCDWHFFTFHQMLWAYVFPIYLQVTAHKPVAAM
jgi:hypothetical protein